MRLRETVLVLLMITLQLPLGSRCALCQWEHVGPDSSTSLCVVFRAGDADTAYAGVGGSQPGVYRSTDGGLTWNSVLAPWGGNLATDPVNKNTVYLATQWRIYKSVDGGDSWVRKDTGITLDPGDQFLSDIAINPCHPETVYVTYFDFGAMGGETLWRTWNGGDRWARTEMPGSGAVALDPQNCGRMYTAGGGINGRVLRSLNSGTTWEEILSQYVEDIAINPQNPDRVYFVASDMDTIYRTQDGGNTWMSFGPEAGLTGAVRCIAVNPINPHIIYAGGYGGVFRSINGGTTWSAFDEGLPPSSEIRSIAVDGETGRTLLIGTFDYGIFRQTEPLADVAPPPSTRGTSIFALQVSPNPFRGETGIYYRLPTPAFAALDVYDVTGRLVNRLASGHRPAGFSTAAWNGKDALGSIVAPGIYFLELTTTTDRKTRTIVLLK